MHDLILIYGDDRLKAVAEALRDSNPRMKFNTRSLNNWSSGPGEFEPCVQVFLCARGEKADAIAAMYQGREIDVQLIDVDALLGGDNGSDDNLDPDTGEPREPKEVKGVEGATEYGESGQGDPEGLSEERRAENAQFDNMGDLERSELRDQEQMARNKSAREEHAGRRTRNLGEGVTDGLSDGERSNIEAEDQRASTTDANESTNDAEEARTGRRPRRVRGQGEGE